jgi:hypothetical protein
MYSASPSGAVANPLAGGGHDRLTSFDVDDTAFVLDAKRAPKHDGDFLERWALTGLTPPLGDTMRATLTEAWPEFTRPAYSSIRLGGVPAACTMAGASISLGMP